VTRDKRVYRAADRGFKNDRENERPLVVSLDFPTKIVKKKAAVD
jgi:hypothetical protein